MTTIQFYRMREPYGFFSNFAPYPITIDNVVWPTTEHYFQAQKFLDRDIQARIRETPSPSDAASIGRNRAFPLRADWEAVKDEVMYTALKAKFTQHAGLREQLHATGSATLIEHTTNDRYWADGGDGSGKNMLGILLMRLRDELGK